MGFLSCSFESSVSVEIGLLGLDFRCRGSAVFVFSESGALRCLTVYVIKGLNIRIS